MKALVDHIKNSGASVEELSRKETWAAMEIWSSVYSAAVQQQTGSHVYRGHLWHAFSYGFTPHRTGLTARREYELTSSRRWLVVVARGEGDMVGFAVEGAARPDTSLFSEDVYVFPESGDWTMAFTHHGDQIGPFFSRREWCVG